MLLFPFLLPVEPVEQVLAAEAAQGGGDFAALFGFIPKEEHAAEIEQYYDPIFDNEEEEEEKADDADGKFDAWV